MKKRKRLILSCLLALLCTGMAQAEDNVTAYTYVQKSDGTTETSAGTAAFDVSSSNATLSFDSYGNAIMTIGDNTVAKLPLLDGAQLASDFTTTGTGTVTGGNETYGWATLFSPFKLIIPASPAVDVYAPTYGNSKLTFGNKITSTTIPAGTGLVLKNKATQAFEIDNTATAPASITSSLSGIAVATATSTLNATTDRGYVFSLGSADSFKTFGFYKYVGTNLGAGRAYLKLALSEGSAKEGIAFDFGELTDIDNVDASTDSAQASKEGKFLINGRVVILKGGKMYNLNGQEVK